MDFLNKELKTLISKSAVSQRAAPQRTRSSLQNSLYLFRRERRSNTWRGIKHTNISHLISGKIVPLTATSKPEIYGGYYRVQRRQTGEGMTPQIKPAVKYVGGKIKLKWVFLRTPATNPLHKSSAFFRDMLHLLFCML